MIPQRPAWPWSSDAARIIAAERRWQLLNYQHEDLLRGFLDAQWPAPNVEAVGQLDTSRNTLAFFCASLSTPGLHGTRADVGSNDPAAAPLISTNGVLDQMAWSAIMQRVEYYTRGMGMMFVIPYITDRGAIDLELVAPFDLQVECNPNDPKRPLRLYHLRRYFIQRGATREQISAFNVYDITDPENPRFYVVAATDITTPIGEALLPANPELSGDLYPWRYSDDTPFIPGVVFRRDATDFWGCPSLLDGLERGTYFAGALGVLSQYGAAAASFPRTYFLGCRAKGGTIIESGGQTVRSVSMMPGVTVELDVDQDVQNPQIITVAPLDPDALFRTTANYENNMLAGQGLRAADTTRTNAGANPTSAAALVITDSDRRQAQVMLAPVFRPSDLELISQIAALSNKTLGTAYPESGYSISYHVLPLTPEERARQIDEAKDERAAGMISQLELYQRYHPGTDTDGALQALVRAHKEELLLQQAIAGMPPLRTITERRAPAPAPAPEDTEDMPSAPEAPTPTEEE